MRKASTSEHIWTVLEIIRWGVEYFKAKDIDSPRLTIELMLCSVLGVSRISLYTQFDRPLLRDELDQLRSFVERRVKREPLQYILGEAFFFGLKFSVDRRVLIPRPETEILVDRAIRWCKTYESTELKCLDVGTGSGCIPIAVAHHALNTQWLCIDDDQASLDLAAVNAESHGFSSRIQFRLMNFREEIPGNKFGLITMNPPYIAPTEITNLEDEVKMYEPLRALTDDSDGLHFYRRMADVANDLLSKNGMILVEVGYNQSSSVVELFEDSGFSTSVVADLSGLQRVVCIERR
ncbi:MAG: peptide chain release factor N(5)-glutamine methyltransferase [Ignavibacteria bacterium]|nr:peptide chain release factor N(5)-glutamine methyltransferase [Ignavibacteria bacterium]